MAMETLSGGNIEPRGLEEEMKSSYLDYAMSVIVGRALPDARDGLKPVHRRVLFAMNEIGLQPNRPYRKCACIVGEVMGKYHPHGDSAIYDTLVRLAQDFSMRYPLSTARATSARSTAIPPAAMRYTEARLSRIATEMLRDLDADTVDFTPNYDDSQQEPLVLPARFPNLLVNGSSGIAVGMATNIPPHNLRETIGAVTAFIDDPDIDVEGLMKHIKGPDFPTGGIILGMTGHPRGLRDRPRTGAAPGPRAHRAAQAGQGGDRGHRAALHGQEGRRRRAHPEDRRPGQARRSSTGSPTSRTTPTSAGCAWSSSSSATPSPRSCSTSSTSTRRCRRRSASTWSRSSTACPGRCRYARRSRPTFATSARSSSGAPSTSWREKERRAHILEGLLIALDNLDEVIAHDPRLARRGRRAPRADGRLLADRSPGARHPRHAPARSSRRWRATRSAPSTRTSSSASRSCGRSSATRSRSWGSSRTSSRRSPTPTATSAAPRSPTPRARSTSRT